MLEEVFLFSRGSHDVSRPFCIMMTQNVFSEHIFWLSQPRFSVSKNPTLRRVLTFPSKSDIFIIKTQLFYIKLTQKIRNIPKKCFCSLDVSTMFPRIICTRLTQIVFLKDRKNLFLGVFYILRAHSTLRMTGRAPNLGLSGLAPCHWYLAYLLNVSLKLRA